MFKIEEDVIYLTRGDKAAISLSIEDYVFKTGDIIKFRVYNRRELDKPTILEKEISVTEDCESVDIELSSEDTKIGAMSNRAIEFWYEIELNNNQTILGYDENGAKKLMLYPEGVEND